MKKSISILLVLVMLLGACICTGSAEQVQTDETSENSTVVEFADLGFKYVLPEAYNNATGIFRWVEMNGEPDFWYLGLTEEMIESSAYKDEIRSNNLITFDTMRKWCDESNTDFHRLFSIFLIKTSTDPEYRSEFDYSGTQTGYIESNTGRFIVIESYRPAKKYLEYWAEHDVMEDYVIQDLIDYGYEYDDDLFISGFQPIDPEEVFTYRPVGFTFTPEEKEQLKPVHFETTDLDGNPVKSEELFAAHKVTMINIWATWCQPCQNEMPGLEEMTELYADEDCQIISICDDATGSTVATAKSILANKGVTYLNLKPPAEMAEMFGNYAYPNSFFVDSKGNFLVRYVGAGAGDCSQGLEAALEAVDS